MRDQWVKQTNWPRWLNTITGPETITTSLCSKPPAIWMNVTWGSMTGLILAAPYDWFIQLLDAASCCGAQPGYCIMHWGSSWMLHHPLGGGGGSFWMLHHPLEGASGCSIMHWSSCMQHHALELLSAASRFRSLGCSIEQWICWMQHIMLWTTHHALDWWMMHHAMDDASCSGAPGSSIMYWDWIMHLYLQFLYLTKYCVILEHVMIAFKALCVMKIYVILGYAIMTYIIIIIIKYSILLLFVQSLWKAPPFHQTNYISSLLLTQHGKGYTF